MQEYDRKVTGVPDCGVTLQSILSGQSRIPPQGARIDVAFEGRAWPESDPVLA